MSEQFAFPSDIPRQTGFAVVDEVKYSSTSWILPTTVGSTCFDRLLSLRCLSASQVNHPEPVQLRYEVYGTGPTKIVLCMGFGTALEAVILFLALHCMLCSCAVAVEVSS